MKPFIEKKGSNSGSCADGFGVCCTCKYTPKSLFISDLKSRPCDNSLPDFHKISLVTLKKADGQALKNDLLSINFRYFFSVSLGCGESNAENNTYLTQAATTTVFYDIVSLDSDFECWAVLTVGKTCHFQKMYIFSLKMTLIERNLILSEKFPHFLKESTFAKKLLCM